MHSLFESKNITVTFKTILWCTGIVITNTFLISNGSIYTKVYHKFSQLSVSHNLVEQSGRRLSAHLSESKNAPDEHHFNIYVMQY
jgi:hypothetical protein